MSEAAVDIEVVVIALLGGTALDACLARLDRHWSRCSVVLSDHARPTPGLRERCPGLRVIEAGSAPVPVRRALGLRGVTAERVALIEDTCLPAAGWLQAACEALDDPAVAAAGGPVDFASGLDARSLAMACGEYARFSRAAIPAYDDRASAVAGNNFALRCPAVTTLLERSEALVEGELFAALRAEGWRLALHPDMRVQFVSGNPRDLLLRARFRHGRLYAGGRVAGCGPLPRAGWVLKSLLLPFLLSARALSGMLHSVPARRWPAVGIRVVGFEVAWALGESVGYFSGAGRALEDWR